MAFNLIIHDAVACVGVTGGYQFGASGQDRGPVGTDERGRKQMSDTATVAAPCVAGRSRVKTLSGVDGRTRAGRAFRDALDGLVVQFDVSDESDMRLCRLAASYSVLLEESA